MSELYVADSCSELATHRSISEKGTPTFSSLQVRK